MLLKNLDLEVKGDQIWINFQCNHDKRDGLKWDPHMNSTRGKLAEVVGWFWQVGAQVMLLKNLDLEGEGVQISKFERERSKKDMV